MSITYYLYGPNRFISYDFLNLMSLGDLCEASIRQFPIVCQTIFGSYILFLTSNRDIGKPASWYKLSW